MIAISISAFREFLGSRIALLLAEARQVIQVHHVFVFEVADC
jgi:hypothetical protein